MASSKLLVSLFIFQVFFVTPAYSKLFREYIGADDKNVSFSDVPINPKVDFHFILSFAIDYTNTSSPSPTNGEFIAYWDKQNLNPSRISSIKADHPNVKVAMSLAGDSVNDHSVYFSPYNSCLAVAW